MFPYIKTEKNKQIEWILLYLEWKTYGQSKWIWENWPIINGDESSWVAPKRPSYEILIKMLENLTKKGVLIRDPHHWNDYCYFYAPRKVPIWQGLQKTLRKTSYDYKQ